MSLKNGLIKVEVCLNWNWKNVWIESEQNGLNHTFPVVDKKAGFMLKIKKLRLKNGSI